MCPDKRTVLADRSLDGEIAEYERQFREILEHCPAGLNVVDEDGELLFHNARIRELLGYSGDEPHLFDTRKFWHDLDQRARIIKALHDNAEQVLNEEAIWRPVWSMRHRPARSSSPMRPTRMYGMNSLRAARQSPRPRDSLSGNHLSGHRSQGPFGCARPRDSRAAPAPQA
jgi:PAS domain-containing protein